MSASPAVSHRAGPQGYKTVSRASSGVWPIDDCEQTTPVFKERYARRAGVESTNSGLKRRLGLGRLRVRGRKAVQHALYLKAAGWNLLRAAAALARRRAAPLFWLAIAGWMAGLATNFSPTGPWKNSYCRPRPAGTLLNC